MIESNKLKAVLIRLDDNGTQTLGRLQLFNELDIIFEGVTLELPFRANIKNISCIPTGLYRVIPRTSEKHGLHYIIKDVLGRKLILIHTANYYTQLRGCIAIGSNFYDINADGEFDITNSRRSLKTLLAAAPRGFELTII
jgi:hypothetical protein